MALNCGQSCIKYSLIAFNVLGLIFGVTLVAISSVMLSNAGGLSQITFALDFIPIVLLILGVLSTLVAFFGCCGAVRLSPCLLYMYSVFLMILLLAKGLMAIVSLWQKDELMADMQRYLRRLWQERQRETYFWDKLQTSLNCCGLNGPSDWKTNIPSSCCQTTSSTSCSLEGAWPLGCETATSDIFGSLAIALAAIGLVAAVLELIGFVATCVLISATRKQNRQFT